MNSPQFRISERHAKSLELANSAGRPPSALARRDGPLVDDMREVPDDAEYVAIRGDVKAPERLAELEHLVSLSIWRPTLGVLRRVGEMRALRALYVVHFRQLADVPIGAPPKLEHLLLDWAPRIADLSFLGELPALRTVWLDSMKRTDFDSLPELPNLRGLLLSGGMWNWVMVPSLAPLARVPALEYLSLTGVRATDGSLKPIGGLRALRQLELPNIYAIEEYAHLAARLDGVRSNALGPMYGSDPDAPTPASSVWACPLCTTPRRMMTGKPALVLCPSCDADRVRKRVVQWELARR